ncbi:MAG: DUF302 domain-containing protein [Mariniphaga sp.]
MESNQLIIEKVSPWDFEKTVEVLTIAAGKRNWMIPAIHDLQQSLAKAGKDVRPVKVLEFCKPEYSGKMLEKNDERIVSVMMPCRISIYLKEDDKTYIALLNGANLAAGLPEIVREVMVAASDEINEIVDSVC